MPSSFLLLIILVAGYIFLSKSVYFKFRQQRLNQQRLIFETIFWGVVLFAITYACRIIIEIFIPRGHEFTTYIHSLLPVKEPLTGTSIATILLSVAVCVYSNARNRQKHLYKAIDAVGNDLEKTIKEAMILRSTLQFTLNNGKVYVGWITKAPIPSDYNYIRLIPLFSGYRDDTTKEMVPTTLYVNALENDISKLIEDDKQRHESSKKGKATVFKQKEKVEYLAQLHIDITIPLDKITSVSYYNPETYDKLNPKVPEKPEGTPPAESSNPEKPVVDQQAEEIPPTESGKPQNPIVE